jgi:hypothetical protein
MTIILISYHGAKLAIPAIYALRYILHGATILGVLQ